MLLQKSHSHASQGVRVNAIASGPVETTFLQERIGFFEKKA